MDTKVCILQMSAATSGLHCYAHQIECKLNKRSQAAVRQQHQQRLTLHPEVSQYQVLTDLKLVKLSFCCLPSDCQRLINYSLDGRRC